MSVLCLIEIDGQEALDASLRAAGVAAALAESGGDELIAAWFGSPDEIDAGKIYAIGVVEAFAIGSAQLAGYAPLAWGRALAALAARLSAAAVVAAATDRGNEVLAHCGAITGLPMAANCVSATWVGPGECRLVRQRWGGILLEEAVLNAPTALLTVAADAVSVAEAHGTAGAPGTAGTPGTAGAGAGRAPLQRYLPELADGDLIVRATKTPAQSGGAALATARVVVGGGRGVGGAAGFAALEELAGLLGGAVGVSRVVTSQGWRPHRQQVGQTGTKITPDLYLACGISGAIQHLAGCQGAKTVIAVNTDQQAPIMARADYAVIGDLHEVIPALVDALRARQS